MTATPDISTPTRSLLEGYAEAQRYFVGRGILNNALAELAERLTSHGIDYVVIGAVALKEHGYKRLRLSR